MSFARHRNLFSLDDYHQKTFGTNSLDFNLTATTRATEHIVKRLRVNSDPFERDPFKTQSFNFHYADRPALPQELFSQQQQRQSNNIKNNSFLRSIIDNNNYRHDVTAARHDKENYAANKFHEQRRRKFLNQQQQPEVPFVEQKSEPMENSTSKQKCNRIEPTIAAARPAAAAATGEASKDYDEQHVQGLCPFYATNAFVSTPATECHQRQRQQQEEEQQQQQERQQTTTQHCRSFVLPSNHELQFAANCRTGATSTGRRRCERENEREESMPRKIKSNNSVQLFALRENKVNRSAAIMEPDPAEAARSPIHEHDEDSLMLRSTASTTSTQSSCVGTSTAKSKKSGCEINIRIKGLEKQPNDKFTINIDTTSVGCGNSTLYKTSSLRSNQPLNINFDNARKFNLDSVNKLACLNIPAAGKPTGVATSLSPRFNARKTDLLPVTLRRETKQPLSQQQQTAARLERSRSAHSVQELAKKTTMQTLMKSRSNDRIVTTVPWRPKQKLCDYDMNDVKSSKSRLVQSTVDASDERAKEHLRRLRLSYLKTCNELSKQQCILAQKLANIEDTAATTTAAAAKTGSNDRCLNDITTTISDNRLMFLPVRQQQTLKLQEPRLQQQTTATSALKRDMRVANSPKQVPTRFAMYDSNKVVKKPVLHAEAKCTKPTTDATTIAARKCSSEQPIKRKRQCIAPPVNVNINVYANKLRMPRT